MGGIKASYNNGKLDEVFNLDPDILCIQEVKAEPKNVDANIIHRKGYNSFFYPSSLYKAYSGVAIYTKFKPISLRNGFGSTFDVEGRIQKIEFEEFDLFNVYFPLGGSRNSIKTKNKTEFYKLFTNYVDQSEKPQVICGDLNRVASIKDMCNPGKNKNSDGFRPEELEWFENFLEMGFVDSFRLFNNEEGQYTWWPNHDDLKETNQGFRFDYFLVNEKLRNNIKNAQILSDIYDGDHVPILLELDF